MIVSRCHAAPPCRCGRIPFPHLSKFTQTYTELDFAVYQERQVVRHFLADARLPACIKQSPMHALAIPPIQREVACELRMHCLRHINGVLHYGLDRASHREFEVQGKSRHACMASGGRALPSSVLRDRRGAGDGIPQWIPSTTEEALRLLQGRSPDAMTHVGQLAMLRRLAGAPVAAENFFAADIRAGVLGTDQPPPVSPDE